MRHRRPRGARAQAAAASPRSARLAPGRLPAVALGLPHATGRAAGQGHRPTSRPISGPEGSRTPSLSALPVVTKRESNPRQPNYQFGALPVELFADPFTTARCCRRNGRRGPGMGSSRAGSQAVNRKQETLRTWRHRGTPCGAWKESSGNESSPGGSDLRGCDGSVMERTLTSEVWFGCRYGRTRRTLGRFSGPRGPRCRPDRTASRTQRPRERRAAARMSSERTAKGEPR